MARETPGNAIFFVTYEGLRRALPGRPAPAAAEGRGALAALGDAASSVVCGGLAGMVMWLAVRRARPPRCLLLLRPAQPQVLPGARRAHPPSRGRTRGARRARRRRTCAAASPAPSAARPVRQPGPQPACRHRL
jgi:hypothetical protein